MSLLTRREIIELWETQSDDILDSYCCPNCRDILFEYPDKDAIKMIKETHLYCHNKECSSYNFKIKKPEAS